jgi:cobalt-zinc-cadmium efflux system protein
MAFTAIVLVVETAGGFWTHSLALLSDAGHVFMDFLALILTYLAIVWSSRPANNSKTYGYHRLEIFAAFINGISIAGIAIMIFIEAYRRMREPVEVNSFDMMVIAILGLVVNAGIAVLLMRSRDESLNVRSAFLHVIGDALASVGVIIGGVVMIYTKWYLIDPIVSVVIAGIIVVGGWRVLRESFHTLLEGAPTHIDPDEVVRAIQGVENVCRVHDFHVWCLSSHVCALSAHIIIRPEDWTVAPEILARVEHVCKEHFGIYHTTIQMEKLENQEDQVYCDIASVMPAEKLHKDHHHHH